MPTFKHGKNTSVWLDSVDVSQYFSDISFNATIATANTSTFGVGWDTFIEGLAGSKVDAKGFYDLNNDAAMAANIRDGGSVLTYGPGGISAIGDMARLVNVHETAMVETSPVGGAVLMTVAFNSDNIAGFGYALHPLAVDTGTTTGANRDDLASSATGWHAHLHVTAVSSGTWTIKLVDASASNFSDVADVTGASFTAVTVPGAQRLTSATGTTALRRYVRYVATAVGGSTPTITFGLALSRN
jgi:hypothetical protein